MKKTLWVLCVWMALGTTVCVAEEKTSGAWSVGIHGGVALPTVREAVDGFSETGWSSSSMVGASAMYRWSNGFAVEIGAQRYTFELEEGASKFGTLELTPIVLLVKYQGLPQGDRGFAGHFDLGGGVALGKFSKGGFVTDLERATGAAFAITTKPSFVFQVGGGVDYFLTKWLSLNVDGRWLFTKMGTDWSAQGPGGAAALTEIDSFHVSNFQFIGGARLWLR